MFILPADANTRESSEQFKCLCKPRQSDEYSRISDKKQTAVLLSLPTMVVAFPGASTEASSSAEHGCSVGGYSLSSGADCLISTRWNCTFNYTHQ